MMEKIQKIVFDGKILEVASPATGNAGYHVANILLGKDYPLLGGIQYHPDTLIDIGANIGATALFLANAYPTAQCFCYEPSPANFALLERNVSSVPRIHCFNYGLSDTASQVRLYLGKSQCLQHSLFPSAEVSDTFEEIDIRPAMMALRDSVGERCILKVDTEGCEVPILRSLAPLLPNIDLIYLEYHNEADRRTLDAILKENFRLWFSRATMVHRGNLGYVSHRLMDEFPALGQFEIQTT